MENQKLRHDFVASDTDRFRKICEIMNWVDERNVRRGYLADRTINGEDNLRNFEHFKALVFDSCTGFQFKEILQRHSQKKAMNFLIMDTNYLITHANHLPAICDQGIVIVPQISQYEVIQIHLLNRSN